MAKQSTGPGRTSTAQRSNPTRPLGPRVQRIPSQAKSPARLKLEQRSAGPLRVLHRMPRMILPVLMAVLLLAGLLLPSSLAGLLLLALAGFLGWLLALSWPALVTSSRLLRLVVVAAIICGGVWRLTGNG